MYGCQKSVYVMRALVLLLLLPTVQAFGLLQPGRSQPQVASASRLFSIPIGANQHREPRVWLKHPPDGAKREGRPRRIVTRAIQLLLDAVVTIIAWPIAAVLAKVINHPSVRTALGQCIVSGFKDICEDPELDHYVDEALATVAEDLDRDARETGEAFPSVAKEFLLGVLGVKYEDDEEQERLQQVKS